VRLDWRSKTGAGMDSRRAPVNRADPVELEVFRHLLSAVAEEMGARLMRSAFSPNIKERRDFSCALLDAGGALLAQAAHIPVHLGSMPMSAAAILAKFPGAEMTPGQVFIVNDPYEGGTHLPDITVLMPVILRGEAAPRFFVANRAHHADVGGKSPGSMPLSRHIDEEGIRIAPSLLDDALVSAICDASRTPGERRGDLQAQLASLGAGAERMAEICASYGSAHVSEMGSELVTYSERIMRTVIAEMPDGEYRATDYLDNDGLGTDNLEISCTVSIEGDTAKLDFSESAPQAAGPVNAVRAITHSAVNYVFRCLAPPELPTNAGVMHPLTVVTRPGSVVDAVFPAPVAAGNVETSQRIVDVVLRSLSQAVDWLPAASQGTMNNLAIGGTARDGAGQFSYYETTGGGCGASGLGAGASAVHSHMTNTLNTPVEALEHAYPLRVAEYRIRRGSGGRGRHHGGDGIVRRIEAETACEAVLLTERRVHEPYGLAGGGDGAHGVNTLIRADGGREQLPSKCTFRLEPGDQLAIETPGGGGWGSEDDRS